MGLTELKSGCQQGHVVSGVSGGVFPAFSVFWWPVAGGVLTLHQKPAFLLPFPQWRTP